MHAQDIHAALDHSRIEARFQPIVRLSDRAPAAFEALARIDHPLLGLVLADRFVPLMERSGRGAELTDQVSASVIASLAQEWPGQAWPGQAWPGLHGLPVGINLPLDLLLRADTIDRLAASCADAGVAPSRLVLELTETQPVEDPVALGRALERARRAGFGAAIDDVGPAMHWVNALLDLPFIGLKLDAALLAPAAADFAAGMVAAASRRGLTVTAEGVTDNAAWDRAAALGADRAQGFGIAPALAGTMLAEWWRGWQATPGCTAPPIPPSADHAGCLTA